MSMIPCRRIAKKVDGAIVEKYLWSGMTQLLAVYDGSDNLMIRFEYADDQMPVAMVKDGTRYYLAYDPVGSLRVVTDGSGVVVKQTDYDSFGCKINDTDPLFTVPFGFAGGLHDRDTGLVRFGYRDYDPDTGRWTAKDPIGFAGGDTDLYGYCLNDPVNWVDPRGLIEVNIGTDKHLSEKVQKAKEAVKKADWLNSDLQDQALDKLDWLEEKAEKVDACIHHEVAPEVPGTLTIEPIRDGLKVEGVKVEYKLKF